MNSVDVTIGMMMMMCYWEGNFGFRTLLFRPILSPNPSGKMNKKEEYSHCDLNSVGIEPRTTEQNGIFAFSPFGHLGLASTLPLNGLHLVNKE